LHESRAYYFRHRCLPQLRPGGEKACGLGLRPLCLIREQRRFRLRRLSHYTRQDLEAARDAGTPLHIQVLGLATIASDVTPELARAAIASVQVLGAFQASPAVKAALADRTT
jgi:hypothetical protein